MSATFRAAVVQAAPVLFDMPRTMARLADRASQAAAGGAGLAIFPEAFLGGYPKGLDFGARLGMRGPQGRKPKPAVTLGPRPFLPVVETTRDAEAKEAAPCSA